MRAFWLSLLLLSCACSNHRYFVPRENTNGTGPGGYPAAVYRIDAGVLGGAVGEVRVWSEGAHFVDTEDDEVVELHLGFEIENTSTVPLATTLRHHGGSPTPPVVRRSPRGPPRAELPQPQTMHDDRIRTG